MQAGVRDGEAEESEDEVRSEEDEVRSEEDEVRSEEDGDEEAAAEGGRSVHWHDLDVPRSVSGNDARIERQLEEADPMDGEAPTG